MIVPEFSYYNHESKQTEAATVLAVRFGDDAMLRRATANVTPFFIAGDRPRPLPAKRIALVLWQGDEYDAIGDYTQEQVESRVLELLGDLSVAFGA